MPVEKWHGGKTHVIARNIRHLMREQVFELDGQKIFVFGGAQSHDIQDGILDPNDPDFKKEDRILRHQHARYRVKGISWWPGEMPSEGEYAEGIRNLESVGWQVDYIITHCAPTSVQAMVDERECESNQLTDYLEEVRQKCRYKNSFSDTIT